MNIARFEQPTEPTEENAHEFYSRLAKERGEHAARLHEMYKNRKVTGTPLTDAIWWGYQALKDQAEEFAVKAEKSKVPQ